MAAQKRNVIHRIGDWFNDTSDWFNETILRRKKPDATPPQKRSERSFSRLEPCLGQLPTGIPCTAQVELDDKRATACTMCGTPALVICQNCNQRLRGGQRRCSTCGAEQYGVCHACGKRLDIGIHSCERCHLAEMQKGRAAAHESRSPTAQQTKSSETQSQKSQPHQPTNIPIGVPLKQVEYDDV